MSITAAQLVAKVSVEGADSAKSQLSDVGKSADTTSGGFGSMLKSALSTAAGFAIFNLGGKAVGFLKDQLLDCVTAAMAHQQIMAQTAQALKSTGDASGMTADSIQNLAESFSKVTPFSEDTVQSGENLLLTFTGIGKQVFPQATQAMLDMATAMHQGPQQGAIMLGKALNDPLTGLSALQRVGVTFSASEKEQIKTMMAHNDIIGAQKVMLGELSKEFGGSATAAGKTFGGQLQILQNNFEDLKIKIGTAILPILSQLTGFIDTTVMPILGKFADWFSNQIGPAVHDFENFLAPVGKLIESLFSGGGKGKSPFAGLANDFQVLQPGINAVAGVFKGEFSKDLQFAEQTGKSLSSWFKSDLMPTVKSVLPDFENLGKILVNDVAPALAKIWAAGQDLERGVASALIPVIEKIVPILIKWWGILASGLGPALKFIMPYIVQAAQAVSQFGQEIAQRVAPIIENWFNQLDEGLTVFLKIWNVVWPYLAPILKGIFDEIVGIIKIAWSIVSGIFKIALDLLSGNWKGAWNDLLSMLSGVWDGIKQVISGGIEIVTGWLKAGWAALESILEAPFKAAWNFISGIFNDIKGGISGALGGIGHALHGLGIPGFAVGTSFAPGGLSIVGEHGPELMYIPRGAQIIPNSQLGLGGGAQSGSAGMGTPVFFQVNGQTFARIMMPHIVNQVRNATGVVGM